MMRNTNKTILALMAGAMVFGACSKEDINDNVEVISTGNMTFTATVSDDEGETTRTHLGESNSVLWSKDDMISIFSNGEHSKFTLTSGANTTSGTFSGTCATGGDIYATYPYSKINEVNILSNGTFNYSTIEWNGANQTAVKNSFPLGTPMMACAKAIKEGESEVPLSFQNVCAFVKFTTDYVCKKVVFSSGETGANIASEKIFVDYDENGKPHINGHNGGSQTITLTGKDGANLEAGTYYIAVMPEVLYNGFIISFTNLYDENILTKSTTKSVTLKRNTILNLGKFNIKAKLVGLGTEDDPYLIHDFDQLVEMRDFVNNSTGGADCYKLMNDIDGNGTGFNPIGTQGRPFFGKFDGNGKKISNIRLGQHGNFSILSITTDDLLKHAYISALFGVVKDATIKNVTIDNISLYDNSDTYMRSDQIATVVKSPFVGVVLGNESGGTEINNITINNCQITSFAESNKTCGATFMIYGGVVGASLGNLHIDKCTNNSQISADLYCAGSFGGVLGIALGGQEDDGELDFHSKVTIERCRNFGNISPKAYAGDNWKSGEPLNVGGIVGCFKDETWDDDVCGAVKNCVNFGAINTKTSNSPKERVGGVIGSMDSDGFMSNYPVVSNCINNGAITTSTNAGGILGYVFDTDTKIEFCANSAKIDCQSPGSMLGYYSEGPTFNYCWNNNASCPYLCNNSPADTTEGYSYVNCWPLSNSSVFDCKDHMNDNNASEYKWKVYDEDVTKLDLDF